MRNAGVVFAIFCLSISANSQDTVVEFFCYGQNIDSRCEVGEVMIPESVLAVSMNNSINCSVLPPSLGSPCCDPVNCLMSDNCCAGPYHNSSSLGNSYVYQERCIGREQCEPVYIGGMDASLLGCDPAVYNEQTTLLVINFQCVNDSIAVISEESVTVETHNQTGNNNASIIHLWMNYYNNTSPAFINNTCSIHTDSCDKNIVIDLIDVRLTSETVLIGNDNEQLVLTRENNNDFVRSSMHFSSQKHNLTIRVLNSGDVQNSHLWITFHATSNLTLRCPAVSSTLVCPQPVISVCENQYIVTCHRYDILTVVICMIIVLVFLAVMVLFVVRFKIFHLCEKKSYQTTEGENITDAERKHYPRDVEKIVKYFVQNFKERQQKK